MSSLRLHHELLADRPRLKAMQRAMAETVRGGDVVVDVGAGTGILGFLALRAGASRVYSIECDPVLSLARVLAAENGFQDRVRFIRADSRRVRLPEKADVVVAEVMGRWGGDPGMVEVVTDARRFMKPGGRFIPDRSELWFAPVHAPGLHRRHVRPGSGIGVGLEAFHRLAANRIGFFHGAPRDPVAPLRRGASFAFSRGAMAFPCRMRGVFRVRGGSVHGLAVAVRIRLSASVSIDERSGGQWGSLFLPVARPLRTHAGDRIVCEVVIHDAENVEWAVGECRQSTLMARFEHAV